MKSAALSEVKDDLSRFLRLAETEEIVITRHGRAAGVLIGFASEDDWFDYRLQHDQRFIQRIAAARASLRAGRGTPIDELEPLPANRRKRPDTKPVVTKTKRRRTGSARSTVKR